MNTGTLATYPPRRETLLTVVEAMAPQLEQLNIVLNQYDDIPAELARFPNLNPILPHEDTKDVGKFYPDVSGTYTLLLDDDLIYPDDYVPRTIDRFENLTNPRSVASYHCSTYYVPRPWAGGLKGLRQALAFRRNTIADYREVDVFFDHKPDYRIVDQPASGCCILRSADMPGYDYMRDSQKFVDVRLAKWCFEQDLMPVCLPREKDWIKPYDYEETIYGEFTQTNPPHVSDEIWTYAFRVKNRRSTPALRTESA